MATSLDPETERRVLALFERLACHPGNARFRERLLRRETAAVLRRLGELEALDPSTGLGTLLSIDDAAQLAEPPARIGPFRIGELLGRGGMGAVWKAERDDGLYDQTVAVKLIHPALAARAATAFDIERRILARLDHPNVARIIDGGVTDGGIPFLVMEYVRGAPIDRAAATLPIAQRVRLIVKIADALQHAHDRAIVHADVKPANMLVDPEGRVKLLDFGIALLLGADAGHSIRGAMTSGFASPERTAGDGPSIADDIYALGITMGRVFGNAMDAELAAIVAKARAPEAARRYASVAALIDDLDRWRDQRPVSAMPDHLRYRAGKFLDRHRRAVAAVGIGCVLLGGASLAVSAYYERARHAAAAAGARLVDVQDAARFLQLDLLQALQSQPNALALRVKVAKTAQTYLDHMAADPAADAETRLAAATGLWRLACFQACPMQPNLRQFKVALANLSRAQQLVAPLSGVATEALRGQIFIDRSLVLLGQGATADAEAALASARGAMDRLPARDVEIERRYLHALSTLRGWQGRFGDQVEAADAALALPQEPDPHAAALRRASLLDLRAEARFNLQAFAASLATYSEQLELLESAYRRWPADNVIRARLAKSHWSIATTLESMNDRKASLPHLERGVSLAEQALAFDPEDAESARSLRIIRTAYAQNLAFVGRTEESLAMLRAAAATTLKSWQADPADLARLRDHAYTLAVVGEALGSAHRFEEGCATDAEALARFDELARAGGLTGFDLAQNVSLIRQRRAAHCRAIGDGGPSS